MRPRAMATGSLIAILAGTALGCSSKVATLTLFSTRQVELTQPHDRVDRVQETDRRLWLLFLPLGGAPSGLQAAIRILEEQNADYLTNVEVTEGGWSLLAISEGWVEVEADAWRRRSGTEPR
jgi:hypothetical protein